MNNFLLLMPRSFIFLCFMLCMVCGLGSMVMADQPKNTSSHSLSKSTTSNTQPSQKEQQIQKGSKLKTRPAIKPSDIVYRQIHLPAYFSISLANYQGNKINFLPISLGIMFPIDYSYKKNTYLLMSVEGGSISIFQANPNVNFSHYTLQMGVGSNHLYISQLKPLYKGGYYREYSSIFGVYALGRFDVLQLDNIIDSKLYYVKQGSIVLGTKYWYKHFGISGSILISPNFLEDHSTNLVGYSYNNSASLYLYWNVINNLDVYIYGKPILNLQYKNDNLTSNVDFNLEKYVGVRGYTTNVGDFFGGEFVNLQVGFDKSGLLVQFGIELHFNINPITTHILPNYLLPMEQKLTSFPSNNLFLSAQINHP